MNNILYQKAKRYAMKLNPEFYVDLVHDSYLKWFEKTGKDLFEEREGTVLKVIRNIHLTQTQQGTFMFDREIYRKRFYSMNYESYDPSAPKVVKMMPRIDRKAAIRAFSTTANPETIYIAKEKRENFLKAVDNRSISLKANKNFKKMGLMVLKGFNCAEIARVFGVTPSLVSLYMTQIKWKTILN